MDVVLLFFFNSFRGFDLESTVFCIRSGPQMHTSWSLQWYGEAESESESESEKELWGGDQDRRAGKWKHTHTHTHTHTHARMAICFL